MPGFANSTETTKVTKTVRVAADNIEFTRESTDFQAEGNARVYYGDILLTADQVVGNALIGDVQALGNVQFQNGDRKLTGKSFRYNFKTDKGLAMDASAEVDRLFFHGAEMRAEPGKYTLTGSRFTTCDREPPHYYLSARELLIEPDTKLVAKDVKIVLYGRTIFRMPRYSVPMGSAKGKSGAKLPTLGVGEHSGVFAGYQFNLGDQVDSGGTLDLRLSTKWLVQGGVKYERISGGPFFGRVTYREPFNGGTKSYVMVSRLPEIGIRFGPKDALGQFSSSRESLSLTRGLIMPLDTEPSTSSVNFIGEIGTGKFSEDPDYVTDWRYDARALSWLKPIELGKETLFSPGVFARVSHYGNGDTYSDLGLRLAAARRMGSKSFVSLAYIAHSVHGQSPFTFDQVDLRDEVTARVGFPVGTYKLEVGGRYNLGNHDFFDTEVSIAKVFHCLEPSITWRKRSNSLSFNVGIVGF